VKIEKSNPYKQQASVLKLSTYYEKSAEMRN